MQQLPLLMCGNLRFHTVKKCGDCCSLRRKFCIVPQQYPFNRRCRGSVLRRQPERIISCTGRTEQIGGEFPVKGDPGRLDPVPVSKFVERLAAPDPKRQARPQQFRQLGSPCQIERSAAPCRQRGWLPVCIHPDQQIRLSILRDDLQKVIRVTNRPHRLQRLGSFCRDGRTVDLPAVLHGEHLQPREERSCCGMVDFSAQIMGRFGVDRGLTTDFGKGAAHIRRIFALGQLFTHRRLEFQLVEVVIQKVQVLILLDQTTCCFFSNTCYSRYII